MPDFTGRVVVRLSDDVQVPYQDGVEQQLDDAAAADWAALSGNFGVPLSLDRMLAEFDPNDIQTLSDLAGTAITMYFAVDVPDGIEPEQLASAIAALPFVQLAYAELEIVLATPPSQSPNDPQFADETHLQPANLLGVDALAAWLQPQGDGEGVRLVDIENDWDLTHRDLPSVSVGTGVRPGNLSEMEHGTMVLGTIVAVPENATDCIGIAPAVTVEVMPTRRPSGVSDGGKSAFAQAVFDLIFVSATGPTVAALAGPITPVILLEFQSRKDFFPVEADAGWSELITTAVNLGIAVVEPAGNGSKDLDTFTPGPGAKNPFARSAFVPNDPSAIDSGAIIVGACLGPSSTPVLRPASFSNVGRRIDCFAQGEEVVTLFTGNLVTVNFRGTSSASAIVAAVACCVSAMHSAKFGTPISPLDLRDLLRDPFVNTQSHNPLKDKIGVMPDLRSIISNGV